MHTSCQNSIRALDIDSIEAGTAADLDVESVVATPQSEEQSWVDNAHWHASARQMSMSYSYSEGRIDRAHPIWDLQDEPEVSPARGRQLAMGDSVGGFRLYSKFNSTDLLFGRGVWMKAIVGGRWEHNS